MNQRELFEKWANAKGYDIRQSRIGLPFADGFTNGAWEIWQAAIDAQWQPIEAAPKEEMRDLIVFNGEVQHGQWWNGYWIDGIPCYMYPQPTLWMPLPPEPTK